MVATIPHPPHMDLFWRQDLLLFRDQHFNEQLWVGTSPIEQRELPLLLRPSQGTTGDDVVEDVRQHEAERAQGIAPHLVS